MIPHPFFYLMVVLGLLWLFFLLHLAWPSPCPAIPQSPAEPSLPRRPRSREPKAFAGLTHKPPCVACEQAPPAPSARTYDPSSHISLTPLVAGGRNVGLLVVPARPAPRIPDAPDAVAGCTESDVSGAGRPARGPPTTCPAPVAAAYPAPVRSAASGSQNALRSASFPVQRCLVIAAGLPPQSKALEVS